MTIAVGGLDVDIVFLVSLKSFIEEQCIAILHGRVGLNNRMGMSHSNILQKAPSMAVILYEENTCILILLALCTTCAQVAKITQIPHV